MAGTICLKWTVEEDAVLRECRRVWEQENPRLPHSVFISNTMRLLPHRNKAAIQCRLWALKQPKTPVWSGYAAPTFKLHPTELAWLAGIFDGEGTMQASAKKGWNKGVYFCFNNDRAIIDRVHALVPGSKVKISKKAGSNNGIRTNHDVYTVYVYQYRLAYVVLHELLPYLVHSRKRLRVLDFLNCHANRFNLRGH